MTTQADRDGLCGALPLPEGSPTTREQRAAPVRVQWHNRLQMELHPESQLIWRACWRRITRRGSCGGYVERQDLSPLYARIKAVEGGAGRAPSRRSSCCRRGCTPRSKASAVR